MILRAIFEVMSVKRYKGLVPWVDQRGQLVRNRNGEFDMQVGDAVEIGLLAVGCSQGGALDANQASWMVIPRGEITLQVADAHAVAALSVGTHVYLDIRACNPDFPIQERTLI